ncbi:transcription factor IIIA-like isoform X2 [Lycorma delicatula]|uniref:transcription factor IIIA-like isoform X2 n=1 Tax=Lycorma delicatula TaxID=130591 RepID=UPI003F511785
MADNLGYESLFWLCKVTMGFDPQRELISDAISDSKNTEKEKEREQASCISNDDNCGGSSVISLDKTIKIHACDYPDCNAKFDRPWKLSAHRCVHTGERPYKCNKNGCNKSYTNLTHLKRHEHTSHIDKHGDSGRTPSAFFSPGCNRKFQSKCSLKRHHLLKHGGEGIKCPDCDMVFTSRNLLKSHMFTHDGVFPFKCAFCNNTFLRHGDITKHIRKHKTYKCDYQDCPEGETKIFSSHNELRTHLAQIHPSKYTCENCSKIFTLKCRLRSHSLSCGSDKNDKNYKCIMDDCGHTFKLHRNMLQHVKHKHGAPRYACSVENCGKKFIWKISYKKHIKTYHDPEYKREQVSDSQVRVKKQRKKRIDAGKPKHSVAEILSNVVVDEETEQVLLSKGDVDTDDEMIQKVIHSTSIGEDLSDDSDHDCNVGDNDYINNNDDDDNGDN